MFYFSEYLKVQYSSPLKSLNRSVPRCVLLILCHSECQVPHILASPRAGKNLAEELHAHSLGRTERYRLRLPKHRQAPGFSRESPLFLAGLGSPTVFYCNCYDVRVSVHPNGLLKTTTRADWFHSLLVVHAERHTGLLQTSVPARFSAEKVRLFFFVRVMCEIEQHSIFFFAH